MSVYREKRYDHFSYPTNIESRRTPYAATILYKHQLRFLSGP